MSVFLLVNLQTAYVLAAAIILTAGGMVFFLRTLDDQSTRLLLRLSVALGVTGLILLISALFMVEDTITLGLQIANFGTLFAVICVAEITRRQVGLRKHTGLAVSLIALSFLILLITYDPARPLLGSVICNMFEAVIGPALAIRLLQIRQSGTPVLNKLLAFTAATYGADALFNLGHTLSADMDLNRRGASLVLDQGQSLGLASSLMLSGLFIALLILTVNAQMANRLRHLLSIDELTRLGSRRSLNEQGPGLVARSAQSGAMIAVLMLDIDHFKRINDRFGHAVGDAILRHCSRLMRESLRPEAMLVRYGGEEFCALAPVSQISDARHVAERLRRQVMEQPYRFEGTDIFSSISIGVALARADQPLADTIEQADQALYLAKRNGRNRVCFAGEVPRPQAHATRPKGREKLQDMHAPASDPKAAKPGLAHV